jgi:O-antigen/teichoic acid export membrane protein
MVVDKKLKRRSRLSKNIIYNLCGQVFLVILGFTTIKFIYGGLGGDVLGIIYFTSTLNLILTTAFSLGISTTVTREVSQHYHSELDYIQNLFRTASFFYWGIFILLSFAIYFATPILVDKWIILKTIDKSTAVFVLRVLGIASIIAIPKSIYASLFNGIQRMEFNNIIDVGTTGLRQLGVILILFLDGNLFQVVYWYAACYGIQIMAYITSAARFLGFKAFIPKLSLVVIKRNISFATTMTLITVLCAISNQLDSVILSKLLPISMLGYYLFVKGIMSYGGRLGTSVFIAAFPSFSALSAEGNRTVLMEQFKKVYDFISFATVPIYVFIIFAFVPLLSHIFNVEVAKMVYLPATMLCLGTYLYGMMNVLFSISVAMGKPEISAKTQFYQLLFVVPITIPLIIFFGLFGAGLAYVVQMIFYYTYTAPRVSSECLKIQVRKLYWHDLRILILISVTYGVAWLALSIINNYSIISLAIAYIFATIVFLICGYTVIGEELKGTVFSYLKVFKTKVVTLAYMYESTSINAKGTIANIDALPKQIK